MWLIIAPNLCVERLHWLERFQLGEVHRAVKTVPRLGGKGSNVSRVLREFAIDSHIMSIVGMKDAENVMGMAASEGLSLEVETVDGYARGANIVFSPDTAGAAGESFVATVINEAGSTVGPSSWNRYIGRCMDRIKQEAHRATLRGVLLCGSLPPHMPPDSYNDMIAWCAEHGICVGVDTEPRVLAQAMCAGPTFIFPSLEEAKCLASDDGGLLLERVKGLEETKRQAENAYRQLRASCEGNIVITCGEYGVYYGSSRAGSWQDACTVSSVACTIGAGDTFVAGLVAAYEANGGRLDAAAVAFAQQAAAAQCMTFFPGEMDADEARRLKGQLNG